MEIIAALFIDEINLRQVPGPATRIDLSGIQFSAAAPAPLPFTWAPHLCVIIRCAPEGSGQGVLEVTFHRGEEQIAAAPHPGITPEAAARTVPALGRPGVQPKR